MTNRTTSARSRNCPKSSQPTKKWVIHPPALMTETGQTGGRREICELGSFLLHSNAFWGQKLFHYLSTTKLYPETTFFSFRWKFERSALDTKDPPSPLFPFPGGKYLLFGAFPGVNCQSYEIFRSPRFSFSIPPYRHRGEMFQLSLSKNTWNLHKLNVVTIHSSRDVLGQTAPPTKRFPSGFDLRSQDIL